MVVKKTVEKTPDIAAASHSVPEQSAVPITDSNLAEYDSLQLSKDNIMVDTYTLIKVFTEKGM